MKAKIGQRVLAAVISYQLDISMDRALKLYVRGQTIDPSWDAIGEEMLKHSGAITSKPATLQKPRKKITSCAGAIRA